MDSKLLNQAESAYTYSKTESKDPLENTIYEKLSIGGLRFDEWISQNTFDEDVLLATYPHKIYLLKFVILFAVSTIISIALLTVSYAVSGVVFAIGLLVLLSGLVKYWSDMYVLTDEHIIEKTGSIYDNSYRKIPIDDITKHQSNHTTVANLISLIVRNYEDIYIYTAATGSIRDNSNQQYPEITLKKVPEPEIIKSCINKLDNE
jgi:hypothetical protein